MLCCTGTMGRRRNVSLRLRTLSFPSGGFKHFLPGFVYRFVWTEIDQAAAPFYQRRTDGGAPLPYPHDRTGNGKDTVFVTADEKEGDGRYFSPDTQAALSVQPEHTSCECGKCKDGIGGLDPGPVVVVRRCEHYLEPFTNVELKSRHDDLLRDIEVGA